MGVKVFTAGIMASFLATAGGAQTLDPARVELLRAVLAGNDCSLTEAEAGIVLPGMDFSRDESRAIVGALVAEGKVVLDGSTLTLVDGSCESDNPVADLLARRDVQQFIAIMSENNCSLSEAAAEQIFTARGMSKSAVTAVVGPMLQNGMASFDGAAGVLSVSGTYCAGGVVVSSPESPLDAPGEAPETQQPGLLGREDVFIYLEVMSDQACSVNAADMAAVFAGSPLQVGAAFSISTELADEGLAVIDGNQLTIDSSICPVATTSTPPVVVATPTAPTQAPIENDGTPEAVFLAILAENNCALAEPEARDLFAAAGLRMDQAYAIADALVAAGEASYADNGAVLNISPARCTQATAPAVTPVPQPQTPTAPLTTPPENTNAPRAGVLAMLAANGCTISQGNAAAQINAAGLEYGPSMQILSQMMADGTATSDDGGQTLQVGAPLCVVAAATPQTPREIFIDLIRQNNCSITAAEFSTLLPVDGLDANAAFAMISELETDGVITLPATRDVLTLSAEICR